LANFNKKFIKDISTLVKPFMGFHKELSFDWQNEHTKVFEKLKERFLLIHVMEFPNFSNPFKVHTNVSGFAIEGVLIQDGHFIVFENKLANSCNKVVCGCKLI
jgi:hypothetical protein